MAIHNRRPLRFADAGARIIRPIRPTPFDRFFLRDPHGYVLQIIRVDPWKPE